MNLCIVVLYMHVAHMFLSHDQTLVQGNENEGGEHIQKIYRCDKKKKKKGWIFWSAMISQTPCIPITSKMSNYFEHSQFMSNFL